MRHTHSRAQRFGGHTKHSWECICGRVVSGNGGKQHFKLDGHRRLTAAEQDARRAQRIAEAEHALLLEARADVAREQRNVAILIEGMENKRARADRYKAVLRYIADYRWSARR